MPRLRLSKLLTVHVLPKPMIHNDGKERVQERREEKEENVY